MGEDACYLSMLDADGRLIESPVVVWPVDADLDPPAGLRVVVGAADPPEGIWALRLPELAGADRARLESPAHDGRLRMLVNAALEERVVLLHGPDDHDAAQTLAELIRERVTALQG